MTSEEGLAPLHAAEAVALSCKALGILDSSAPSPEAYTVRDLTEHPPLREGYSLAPRVAITQSTNTMQVTSRLTKSLERSPAMIRKSAAKLTG